jgi:hypothetical protein
MQAAPAFCPKLDPLQQADGERRRETGLENGPSRSFDVVLHGNEFNGEGNGIEDCELSTRITAAGLTDGARIEQSAAFCAELVCLRANQSRSQQIPSVRENLRHVGVTVEAKSGFLKGEGRQRLLGVADVVPAQRLIQRRMNDRKGGFGDCLREVCEPLTGAFRELFDGVFDAGAGGLIEPIVNLACADTEVVIADNGGTGERLNEPHALRGMGAVADDIAEAAMPRYAAPLALREHGFKGVEIAVNIAEDGDFRRGSRSRRACPL